MKAVFIENNTDMEVLIMFNFEYYTPTKVIFGRNSENKLVELLQEYGAHKVLIHYGGKNALKSGLINKIKTALDNSEIPYVELGGVVPNPHLSKVREGIELGKREKIDFILAVGGGSVIDSAKAISYGLAEPEYDVWELFRHERKAEKFLPVASVLTIAASGSETSNSCVITNEDTGEKRSYNDNISRPKFTIMNPELTMSLPDYQTESGCADIMMHTMERYFTNGGNMELTDEIAEGLLRTVMKYAEILHNNPMNYEARAEIMWAGSLSHNGLTGCGTGGGDWACHQLEHELGGLYDVTHGAGLAALWGSWARYVYDANPERFAQFATNIFDIPCFADYENTALAGIEAMEDFFRSIHMPTNLHELGLDLTDEQIHELAFKCSFEDTRTIGVFKQLNMKDMEKIYAMAR